MPTDDPIPCIPCETVHLLVVRGADLGTVRSALAQVGVGVDELAAPAAHTMLRVGSLVIYRSAHEVWLGGRRVDCTPTEFALLAHLGERPGQVLSRRQLLDRLRGSSDFVTERTVDSHVGNLRRKLAQDPDEPPLLVTVYGVGYRLRAARPRLEALPAQPAAGLRSGINGG